MQITGATGPKLLANLVAGVVTPIFARAGFAKASIVLDWDKIVSPAFSQFCQAIKVTFPVKQKSQGVLHVRVTSAMSLAVSYQIPQIVDRVNQYYGYQAIANIKIHQGPLAVKLALTKQAEALLDPKQRIIVDTAIAGLPSGELKEALQSFGISIYKAQNVHGSD